jgi:hypothetical protein
VADNFFLDTPRERRRAQLDAIRTRLGVCRPAGDFDVENALRGTWKMTCDRGTLRVYLTLAPTVPPLVQLLEIASVGTLPAHVDSAVAAIAGTIGGPDQAALAGLIDPRADSAAAARQMQAAAAWGACKLDEVLSVGGERAARVRLSCSKGRLDLFLDVDPVSRKIQRFTLAPSGAATCVQ